jgi:broad specificity phosphatase PhoE
MERTMMTILKRFLALILLLTIAGRADAQTAPTTIFLVRHAEKGPENPDPSLTPAGQRRATALAGILRDAKISAVFTSEFKRTRETLSPVAEAMHLTPTVIPAGKLDSLVSSIQGLPPGSRAAVASHSNLVHLIAERLTGAKLPMLTDADYDRLIVLTITGKGTGEAVVLRYGEP